MVLVYASGTCSAHCRYCYRLDLFNGSTGKTLAHVDRVVDYIANYNQRVKDGLARPPIREALLSGGDPMVLTNKRLARFLYGLADAGVTSVRIGTKELAFFPMRFDAHFFAMLDGFHAVYPGVRVVFMTQFTHPAEFLETDEAGGFVPNETTAPYVSDSGSGLSGYKWMDSVLGPIAEIQKRRGFISVENQTPIILGVNDSAAVLHTLQREVFAKGLGNHYIFQCRDIPGKHNFALPVETCWQLFTESQKGLSGVEKHARFVMSTEQGKIEVVGVSGGRVVFRVLRCPTSASYAEGNVIICESRPDATWFTDYRDAVLFDAGRVFENVR
jgi:lysine 2,3-aminomutase